MRLEIIRPVAAYLREELDLTPDQEAVAVYGLQTLLYPAVDFLCFCLAGWLLGCLATTAVVALATFLLRLFAHGAHSRSPLTCALLGVIVVPALGKTAVLAAPLFTGTELALLVALGFIIVMSTVWRLAPADDSRQAGHRGRGAPEAAPALAPRRAAGHGRPVGAPAYRAAGLSGSAGHELRPLVAGLHPDGGRPPVRRASGQYPYQKGGKIR